MDTHYKLLTFCNWHPTCLSSLANITASLKCILIGSKNVGWSIVVCFTSYRQYFSHVTKRFVFRLFINWFKEDFYRKTPKKHRSLGRFHSLVWTFASRQHGYLKKVFKTLLTQCLITLIGKCSNGICASFQVPGLVKPIKNTKPDVLNVWKA